MNQIIFSLLHLSSDILKYFPTSTHYFFNKTQTPLIWEKREIYALGKYNKLGNLLSNWQMVNRKL